MIETVVSVDLMVEEELKVKKNHLAPDFPTGEEKRICIVSGLYGDELQGQYICYEVIRRIKLEYENLIGIVDVYPALNPMGLDSKTREIPGSGIDMNSIFPGSKLGALGEYTASCIFDDIKGADVCIDLHASNLYVHEVPQVRMNDDRVDELMPIAKCLNVDMIWIHPSNSVLNGSLAYCDERVVRDMNRAQRAAYSQALLDCAMPRRRRLVLCPLAFGEVGVRDRVKSVLHYRRPGVWLSAAAVLLCAALAMTFLTEPKPARTGVSPETASGQTDPDRLRETSSKALIVATTLDPAAQRISYTVQLTEEPEDWIAQKQWYGVASYADVEIFYPTEGSYYRQTDVPHLRFYEWGLADQPTDLESQRPDTDTRYNDYIVDSVTVLSVDGEQRSTFRRVGQSLLLEEAPHYSGGSVSFHAWLQ